MSSDRRAADPFDETGRKGRSGGGLLKGASGFLLLIASASAASFFFGDTIREWGEAARVWAEAGPEASEEPAPVVAAPLPPREPYFWETYSFSVYFGHDSSEPEMLERITIERSLLSAWEACEGALSIELEGHDHFFGDFFAAMDISQERASRVADVMVEELWATQKRDIRRTGYGREKPKYEGMDNKTAALHRRVDAKLYCNPARATATRLEPQDFGLSLVFSENQQSLSGLDSARISSRAKRARAACAGTLHADATLVSGAEGEDGGQNRSGLEASLKRTLERSGGFDAETMTVTVSASQPASDAADAEIAFRCEA